MNYRSYQITLSEIEKIHLDINYAKKHARNIQIDITIERKLLQCVNCCNLRWENLIDKSFCQKKIESVVTPTIQQKLNQIYWLEKLTKNVKDFEILLKYFQFFHFKKMTREAGKTSVKELKVTKADLQPMVPAFQEALEKLQEVLQV